MSQRLEALVQGPRPSSVQGFGITVLEFGDLSCYLPSPNLKILGSMRASLGFTGFSTA